MFEKLILKGRHLKNLPLKLSHEMWGRKRTKFQDQKQFHIQHSTLIPSLECLLILKAQYCIKSKFNFISGTQSQFLLF